MEKHQLKKGISILYDMELNNYLLIRMISKLDYEISCLGHKNRFSHPVKPTDSYIDGDMISCFIGGGLLLGAILGGATGCSEGFINGIGGLIAGIIIGGIIGGIIGLAVASANKENEDDKRNQEYEKQCREYERLVKNDERRVERELQKREALINIKNDLVHKRNLSGKKLKQFYNYMGIDEDYQYLIPIAYMKDFVRLGISDKLEGADGLYYLVRQELRWDQMQATLEDISQKLDKIIDKQSQIYSELCAMENKSNRLVESVESAFRENANLLESVKTSAELATYHSERTAKEAEYQSFLMTIGHK